VRVDQHHRNGGGASEAKDEKFAHLVGRPADQGSGHDGTDTRDHVDERQPAELDAEIVHQEGAHVRHQEESAGCQQRRGGEPLEVPPHGHRVQEVVQRAAIGMQLQMRVDRPQVMHRRHADERGDRNDQQERRVPAPAVGKRQRKREPHHAARGERGLQDPHHAPTKLIRKQIGRDREHRRAQDAGEQARDHAREQEKPIRARQPAHQSTGHEPAIENQQQSLAVETVDKAGREQPRCPGAERVDRYHQPELRGRDA